MANTSLTWSYGADVDVTAGRSDQFNRSAADPEPPASITRPDLSMEQLQYMVRHLQIYLAPCIASVGVVSNLLCIFAMTSRPLTKLSTTHYVIAILVCDAVQLAAVLEHWLNEFGIHLYFVGGWCQFSTFAEDVVRFTSSWTLAALAFDRFICVRHPRLESRYCVPWVARVVIISIVVVATAVYMNISLLYAVIYVGDHAVCHVLTAYAATVERLDCADAFVNALVPCSLVVSFASVTLCQLLYNRHLERHPHRIPDYGAYARFRRRSLYTGRLAVNPEEAADLGQERVVLALVFAFVVLTVPHHSYRILDAVSGLRRTPTLAERLRSYLICQILVHLRYVQMALDTAVIVLCHDVVRRRFVERYLCLRSRCRHLTAADHEMDYTHRMSFDEVSNDDSTIHIIRHEVQRSTATAL